MGEDPPQRNAKAPIDWAKWIGAASSVVGAIVAVVRLLTRS